MNNIKYVALGWIAGCIIGTIILVYFMYDLTQLSNEYLQQEKELHQAQQELKKTQQELTDTVDVCESYLNSIDVIYKYSQEYNVPPEIILGVMKVESNFNADAQNGSYLGIMQIDEDYFASKMEALNLEKNTKCGVSLLSGLQSESDNLHYMLNSYNMGKTGYQNYVKQTGEVSRAYSRKVIEIINNLKERK